MNLKITVERRHFRGATSFINIRQCPLAEALLEMWPSLDIRVGPHQAKIGKYAIGFKGWSENWKDSYIVKKIQYYIDNPDDPLFKPYVVELLDVPEELINLK